MTHDHYIPLKPIPIKNRISMVFVYYGRIDVKDGAFVVINEKDGEDRERKHIPVGSVACIMLEPGTRISHAAVKLAAITGTLLIWVGEAGVRLYSSGQPGGARSDKLLYQAKLALDESLMNRGQANNALSIFRDSCSQNLRINRRTHLLATWCFTNFISHS